MAGLSLIAGTTIAGSEFAIGNFLLYLNILIGLLIISSFVISRIIRRFF